MNNKIRVAIFTTILVAAAYLFLNRNPVEPTNVQPEVIQENDLERFNSQQGEVQKIPTHASEQPALAAEISTAKNLEPKKLPATTTKKDPSALQFEVDEDGLAIVDGDIVMGSPADEGVTTGYAKAPDITLWPDGRVPFFIQADFENPERVLRALEMFANVIEFTPFQNEADVLVFQNSKDCKSYVGKIGGKQPIWISPSCGTTEIAHEIMHALGFIHEQNRSDRESYVKIHWDNVIESAVKNFGLFPSSMMKVSGSAPFDFESIMLYPSTLFSKNGLPTIVTVDPKNRIDPRRELSPSDLKRITDAYSR